jgi:hypothetical protein
VEGVRWGKRGKDRGLLAKPPSPSSHRFGTGGIGAARRPASAIAGAPGVDSGRECRCLNHSTSMGGTRSKVEGGDRHDLEPEGMREDTRYKIYTGSGRRSSYPTSCLG